MHIGKPAVLKSFSSLILIYLQSSGVALFIFIIAAQLCVHVDVISPFLELYAPDLNYAW